MKFSRLISLLFLGLSALIYSCKSDDDSQIFRAYVEGKIFTSSSAALYKPIYLKSNNKTIAETLAKNSGNFVMAGPYETGDYELVFGDKVKSFVTSTPGCKISTDSTKIIIPSGITFITFDSVNLK